MIDFERIKGTYWQDILNQPRALRDTVAALPREMPGIDTERIVLTGMGGSYQILHPLHLHLIAHGFSSMMVETSELLYAMPRLLDERSTVVAVSQSGASAEIVRLLDREGPRYIGISNTPASPLATRAQFTIMTRAGEEGGVSCKTAVTSLAALYWLGQHITGGGPGRVLESAASAVETYVAKWQEHVTALASMLRGVKHVFIAGRGASLAAVGLGAMVQKEAAHFQAEGMSSAALRHGPFEMLGPDSFVLVFEGDEKVKALNQRLVGDVTKTGAQAALCGPSMSEGPFALPKSDDAIRPILELLPTQMMSLALGYLDGREPGKFERITKVTTTE